MSQITISKLFLPFFELEIKGAVMETTTQNRTTQSYTEVIGNDTLKENIKTYLLTPTFCWISWFCCTVFFNVNDKAFQLLIRN